MNVKNNNNKNQTLFAHDSIMIAFKLKVFLYVLCTIKPYCSSFVELYSKPELNPIKRL